MSVIPTYDIDEEGDVLASCEPTSPDEGNIGGNSSPLAVLKLSSKTLSLVSPVFKAMFKPKNGFKESQTGSDNLKNITLGVDSLDSVLLVMRTIHHRNTQNPKKITLEQLYAVASLTDQYMCQEALSLASEMWITSLWADGKAKTDENCADWLWIAKVFGQREIIESLAKDILFHTKLNDHGGSYWIHNRCTHHAMDGFIRGVWDEREKLVKLFIDLIEQKIETFEGLFKESWMTEVDPEQACPSECQMTTIAPLYALRIQMGYPKSNLEFLSLSRICDLFSVVGNRGQSIAFCAKTYSNGRRLYLRDCGSKPFCGRSEDLCELVKNIKQADLSKAILIAAGIEKDTEGKTD